MSLYPCCKDWCHDNGHCNNVKCSNNICENGNKKECWIDLDCQFKGCHGKENSKTCKTHGSLSI